ncbi:MAG: O-antigen ligase family protein [Christensenellales bacterium]
MKNLIEKFYSSNAFLVFFIVVASLGWCLDLTFISYSILCALFCINLLVRDDLSPSLICLPSMMFVFNTYPITREHYIAFSLSLSVALICFSVFMIRKYKNHSLNVHYDKRTIVILIALLGLAMGGLCSKYFSINSVIFAFVLMVSVLVYYILIKNFANINKIDFVYKMFFVSTIILIVQLAFVYLSSGDMLSVIQNKQARIGIGEINLPATVLAMVIPLLFYKAINSKFDYLYVLFAFIVLFFVMLTCCRGAFLFACVFGIVAFVLYFIKTKRKIVPICYLCLILIVTVVLLAFFKEQIFSVLQHFIERGFDDTGRFELWQLGIDYFLGSPIFGVGLQAPTYSFEYTMIHCTIIQILASTGIVGVICFAIYFIDRYKYIFKVKNTFCIFGYLSILICACYGLIDQTFTCAIFHMIIFAILLAIEENVQTFDKIGEDKGYLKNIKF